MGDFLQFNPLLANQLSDADYLSSSTRTGGLVAELEADHELHNKMFYQWSTMVKALADALVAKGYTVSDASLSALTTVLGNILTQADASADPGANKVAKFNASSILKGAELNMTGLVLAETHTASNLILNLGPATDDDEIYIEAYFSLTGGTAHGQASLQLNRSAGALIHFLYNKATLSSCFPIDSTGVCTGHISTICRATTTSGSDLEINATVTAEGSESVGSIQMLGFFLKRA